MLYNAESKTYVGYSANFVERVKEHNNEQGKKRGWTRTRGPWKVLHTEQYESVSDAINREKELKTGKGRDYIKDLLDKMGVG